jgi:hypothetical protein
LGSWKQRMGADKQMRGRSSSAFYLLYWREMSLRDYHINIFYSEENDGYIADIPDLEACSAFGEALE